MRIVIDGRMLGWTGIGRYTNRLLEHLQRLDHEREYVVLMLKKDEAKWRPSSDRFTICYVDIEPYSVAEQTRLAGVIRRLKPDLVHFPHFTVPLLYRGPYVATIHDLTLLQYKNVRGGGLKRLLYGAKYAAMRVVTRSAIRRAAQLTTDTQYVKDELVRQYRVLDSKIAVTPLAVEPVMAEPEPVDKFVGNGDYLLYVGNFYPYKNVGSTIEALSLLGAKYPKLKFVVAGKADYFREELKEQARRLGVADRVIFTGFVSDGEMVSLYAGAKLYVYPSLSEGFGLQGLEAMAQGLPVLAARASCLPEVYGGAAVYFDSHDTSDQAAKLAQVLSDAGMQEQLRVAGRARIKLFSWQRMTEETLAVYQQAAQDGGLKRRT